MPTSILKVPTNVPLRRRFLEWITYADRMQHEILKQRANSKGFPIELETAIQNSKVRVLWGNRWLWTLCSTKGLHNYKQTNKFRLNITSYLFIHTKGQLYILLSAPWSIKELQYIIFKTFNSSSLKHRIMQQSPLKLNLKCKYCMKFQ